MTTADSISSHLVKTLTASEGLNEFFENSIPYLAESFGANRAILIDFRENTGRFNLLHFIGYNQQGRFELQRRVHEMDVPRALSEKSAYFSDGNSRLLYLPLYFLSTLEAVVVFEADSPIELNAERLEIGKIASKFIGLLMSSSRLSINQTGLVDFNDLQRAR